MAQRKRQDANIHGVFVVDKPAGLTSHQVVARLRWALGTRKIGHAGTLDPAATGVLVCGVGKGTKLLHFLVGADKAYAATIRLGFATVTDDAEGEVSSLGTATHVDPDRLAAGVASLTGDIMQQPNAVSAIKIDGQRAYARVRAGDDVDLPARPVTVSAFEIGPVQPGVVDGHPVWDVEAEVTCSSGTYIRALARDLGRMLDTGGHLTRLRRTRVGPFALDAAHALPSSEVERGSCATSLPLMTLAEAATQFMPGLAISEQVMADLSCGRSFTTDAADGRYAAVDPNGRLGAVVLVTSAVAQPETVLEAAL